MTSQELRAEYAAMSGLVDQAKLVVKAAKADVERAKRMLERAENDLWSIEYNRRACEDRFYMAVQHEEALEAQQEAAG